MEKLDVVVIGSGPGGYVAAIRGGQLGLKTGLVEKDPSFGGTCLHRGCIPTKALLHSAALYDDMKRAKDFGLKVDGLALDMDALHRGKQKAVTKAAKGVEYLLKKNKVKTFEGFGRIDGPGKVSVTASDGSKREIEAQNIVIATGSVPSTLPFLEIDGVRLITSDEALNLTEIPESLMVLGAGAVGCEFASLYNSFGSRVTLVEVLPRLLPIEDEEISKELARAFKKRGIDARVDTKLTSAEPTEAGVKVALEGKKGTEEVEVEKLLVAVGRRPFLDGLGLENVKIEMDGPYVRVDSHCRTAESGVYAIGDVINTPWLAHMASFEGILVMDQIAGKKVTPLDPERCPNATYCDPEVASVGLSETKARERGFDVKIGKFPFTASSKANILGHNQGFVKIVSDTAYDEVLGVHIIGPKATELIGEAGVALRVESTTEEIFKTIHAHPTLSESVMEAAHVVWGEPIHV